MANPILNTSANDVVGFLLPFLPFTRIQSALLERKFHVCAGERAQLDQICSVVNAWLMLSSKCILSRVRKCVCLVLKYSERLSLDSPAGILHEEYPPAACKKFRAIGKN